MPKFAFFDIDGTLTSEADGRVPKSAAAALKRARENGHKLFLCSGRCLYNIEAGYFALGMSGAVMGCGSHVIAEGRELHHVSLTRAQSRSLLTVARSLGLELLFEGAGCSLMEPCDRAPRHPVAIETRDQYHRNGLSVSTDLEDPAFAADKLCLYTTDPEKRDEFYRLALQWLSPIDRGRGMYEMVPIGNSKATGILRVLEAYGASLDDAYAFGDSENDRSMLELVPKSVVMGNATPPSLKQSAWYLAPKASEDGLAAALEALGFLG